MQVVLLTVAALAASFGPPAFDGALYFDLFGDKGQLDRDALCRVEKQCTASASCARYGPKRALSASERKQLAKCARGANDCNAFGTCLEHPDAGKMTREAYRSAAYDVWAHGQRIAMAAKAHPYTKKQLEDCHGFLVRRTGCLTDTCRTTVTTESARYLEAHKLLVEQAAKLFASTHPGFTLQGCGPDPAVHSAVAAMEQFAVDVCACSDLKCITERTSDLSTLTRKYADAKGSEEDARRITAAGNKATKCITTLTTRLAREKAAE